MNTLKCVSKVFKSADEIIFDDSSKIVLMSDCHRGDGSFADDFARNQNIYFSALNYYYNENYTYIEIGDGDELWENSKIDSIINEHSHVFWLLSNFYRKGRLYFIFGNHDMVKKNKKFVKKNLYKHFSERENTYIPLFDNIKVHEGLVLKHKDTGNKILLIHGHQVDRFNSDFWLLSRFLVRFLWKPLNLLGVNDPTRAAKNYTKKKDMAKKLTEWVIKEKHMIIAGHNHKPFFPQIGEPPYFNDGSCVHPRCITAIEITDGDIALVKWSVKTKNDGTLFVGKDILEGPRKLQDYYMKNM
ncbi:metallophosphoesterase [Clostridium prolinivorans]|jgi:UDP-2,3-diacylglucosamine pyrophosphatase LpxH|uniref:metallophosphoesterase n=1 Tax=Clostridium prolinivorans TaxID=2769420 RepID=UPI000FDB87FE|nr:metallophosphoesterase [Clostridium prolinivorans]